MLLTKSVGYGSGRGFEAHIRTTRIDTSEIGYSYISGIALKLGDEVIEATSDGSLFINGESSTFKKERIIAGIRLTSKVKGTKKNIFVHNLRLSEVHSIQIRANAKTGMLFIDIDGMFSDSIGLLGSIDGLFARDGETDMSGHWNALGEEWQLRESEPKLFMDQHREPQYPAGCQYSGVAEKKKNLRRRLGEDLDVLVPGADLSNSISMEEATEACSNFSGQLRDFCITDVMATGDIELAQDSFYMN